LFEGWREDAFRAAGIARPFVQDNFSRSLRSVLRGLHFQRLRPQGKLVMALEGRIFDVAVDLRRDSPAFGTWYGVELDAERGEACFVPRGCAHGFLVLSESAFVGYRCDEYWSPGDEGGIRWDDPRLRIDWPDVGGAPLLSPRDGSLPGFDPQGPWFDGIG
jgi:dTDP-4-dehydrorhamnose 3,5-epimerase